MEMRSSTLKGGLLKEGQGYENSSKSATAGIDSSKSPYTPSYYMGRESVTLSMSGVHREFYPQSAEVEATKVGVVTDPESGPEDSNQKRDDSFMDNQIHFSLESIIKKDVYFYRLACLFGLYGFRDHAGNLSIFLCIWNALSALLTLGGFVFFFGALFNAPLEKNPIIGSILGTLFQYISNAIIVYFTRKVFRHDLKIARIEGFYEKSANIMRYSFCCGIVFCLFQVILLGVGIGAVFTLFGVQISFLLLFSFIPLVLYMSGMVTLAVADLNFTHMYVNSVVEGIEKQHINEERYYHVKDQLDEKEKTSPIDSFVIMGIIGILFTIWAVQEFNKPEEILIFCALFLRVLFGLIPVVYGIVRVNDLTDKMTDILFDRSWRKPQLSDTRVALYMAISEKPLRCKILTQQPSSTEIYGTVIGAVLSIVLSFILKNAGINSDDPT